MQNKTIFKGGGWAKTSFKIKPHNDFSLENNQDDKITVWFLSV